MKRAFNIIFIIWKGLSIVRNCFRPNSGLLKVSWLIYMHIILCMQKPLYMHITCMLVSVHAICRALTCMYKEYEVIINLYMIYGKVHMAPGKPGKRPLFEKNPGKPGKALWKSFFFGKNTLNSWQLRDFFSILIFPN